MLEDLIIETEPIDTTNISEQEKVVIDCIESTEIIKFHLTWNIIDFRDKDDILRNWWELNNDIFRYDYLKIHRILEKNFGYKQQQINDLVKDVLMKYYKIKVRTTKSPLQMKLMKYA